MDIVEKRGHWPTNRTVPRMSDLVWICDGYSVKSGQVLKIAGIDVQIGMSTDLSRNFWTRLDKLVERAENRDKGRRTTKQWDLAV